jgi:hypothetical protein
VRRRAVQLGSVLVAIAALALVLYNATLVDRRPPSVTAVALSAPAGGDAHRGQTLTAIDVAFSEPVRTATVEQRFRIEPDVAGTFSWDGATMIYTPSQRLPADTAFTVTIAAGFEDLAGNSSSAGLDPWQFRTVGPPIVTTAVPADGSTDVPATTTIRLTFDRLMDTASVEQAIALDPAAAFQASWSGETVTLTPNAPLAFGTDYTLTVGTGARDTGGSALPEPITIHFATVAAGLGVSATVPTANVSGVSVRTPIAVEFDGPVDPTSVAGALRVTPSVGGDLRVLDLADDHAVASPAPSASPTTTAAVGRVLLLTPGGPLAAHTTYTVTLEPVVRGTAPGAGVAAGRTWTFTTGGPTTSAQNQIAFLSTRSGVRNVWLMNPDGSNQRQLTSELVPVSTYDVSAAGDRIVYAAGGLVKLASVDGSDVRTLTQPGRFEYSPSFGPEARVVYLARRGSDGSDLGWWEVPLDAASGPERQLLPTGAPPIGSVEQASEIASSAAEADTWGRRVAVSDDRRRLLVVPSDGRPVLVDLAPADAQPPEAIPLASAGAPRWDRSADRFLVVASEPNGSTTSVWGIGLDGTASRLAPGAGSAASAPDGGIATIGPAGSGAVEGAGHLVYVAARASLGRPLTTAPDLADRQPSFAPDGASILFLRVQADNPTISAGIWVVDPDGHELRQLSTDGADPRWLP